MIASKANLTGLFAGVVVTVDVELIERVRRRHVAPSPIDVAPYQQNVGRSRPILNTGGSAIDHHQRTPMMVLTTAEQDRGVRRDERHPAVDAAAAGDRRAQPSVTRARVDCDRFQLEFAHRFGLHVSASSDARRGGTGECDTGSRPTR